MQPRQSRDTRMPVLPNLTYSMALISRAVAPIIGPFAGPRQSGMDHSRITPECCGRNSPGRLARPAGSRPPDREPGLRQRLAVLHETRAVGDLVVEPHRVAVRLVRQPVDARTIARGGVGVHMLDQAAPDSAPARFGRHEQVLK